MFIKFCNGSQERDVVKFLNHKNDGLVQNGYI